MSQSATISPAPKAALIIGATGGVGGEVSRALLARGWRIRALNRKPQVTTGTTSRLAGVEWVKGDAMEPASVIAAAEGCALIFHGVNPPQYHSWESQVVRMLEAIRRVVGRKIPIIPFPWPLVRLLSPFNETFREMLEMRYLWTRPLRLDNAKLVNVLGAEPHTPLDQAVRNALEGFGCLKSGASS